MDDHERAVEALELLTEIDATGAEYDEALAAVGDLVDMLDDDVEPEPDIEVPEEWDEVNEWDEAVEEAYDEADIPFSKGTLTQKTIDGHEYYYLQWREGEKVKSQYIAPVSPSE